MSKKIFINTLNFNNPDITLKFLNSLKNINKEGLDLHVIIVDNSTKEKLKIKESDFKDLNLKIIKPLENTGFAAGNNIAIKQSLKEGADYILIINNDVILDRNLLLEMIKKAESDSFIEIVVPKIYFAKGREFHKKRYQKKELGKVIWYAGGKIDWKNMIVSHKGVDEVDKGQFNNSLETDFATGCCMLVKSEVFKKVGFFDEKYFLYYEDADFSQRVKKAGYKIIYEPKAILWHENAGSVGGSGSDLQDYFLSRNRMLFGFKYAPFRTKLALIRESLGILLTGRPSQKDGVRDYYLRRFGKRRGDNFMKKITAIIIAKDAEDSISKTLDSVSLCNQIIVVNNDSKDDTAKIAIAKKAAVFDFSSDDFSELRNFGLKKAEGDFVFYIDSDEIVDEKLKAEIIRILKENNPKSSYFVRRKNFYFGTNPWPKVEKIERLFLKNNLKGWQGKIHESPIVLGQKSILEGYLLHFTHKDLTSMLNKTIEWSKIESELLFKSNHPKMSWWRFPRVMITAFIDSYFKKGGYKAGVIGIIESIFQSYSAFITYARLWEMQIKNQRLKNKN